MYSHTKLGILLAFENWFGSVLPLLKLPTSALPSTQIHRAHSFSYGMIEFAINDAVEAHTMVYINYELGQY